MHPYWSRGLSVFGGFSALVLLVGVGLHANIIRLPGVHYFSALPIADFSVNRELVGASHNVFAGKVLREEGNSVTQGIPFTNYKVEVVSNVKGKLSGGVVVAKIGGYKNGVLRIVEGDTLSETNDAKGAFLQEGATYVFATRYDVESDRYVLLPDPHAWSPLSTDPSLPLEKLMLLAKTSLRMEELASAYKDEVVPQSDIFHGNARNSYSSTIEKK